MTAALIILTIALALTAGWALIQLSETRSGGPAVPAGGDRTILEHSPVGALLLDPALRVTWANDTFCRFFGLNRAEVVGHAMPDLIQRHLKGAVEDGTALEANLLTQYAKGGSPSPFEMHVVPGGARQHRWIEHTSHAVHQGPLKGSRVEYFVNVTLLKNVALHQEAEERRLVEFTRILVELAGLHPLVEGDRGRALRSLSRAVATSLEVMRAELWLLGDDGSRWTLDHYYDRQALRHETPEHRVNALDVLTYQGVLEKLRVLAISDVQTDPRSTGLIGQGLLEPPGGARLDVPIRLGGKVTGVLVLSHHGPRIWTQEEEQFAGSLGDRASLILEATRERGETPEPQAALPPEGVVVNPQDGFIHLDKDLRLTFLNPTVLEWLDEHDIAGDDLVGQHLEDALRGVENASIVAEIRKAARGGGPASIRRQLTSDGPWIDVYLHPSSSGVAITVRNKARQKERVTERSLLESETRFRSVVESLAEALVITDMDDRILYVNRRITDLTGYKAKDLGGKNAEELLFHTTQGGDAHPRSAVRLDPSRTRYEAPLLHRDGETRQVEVISSPLRNADGEVTGVVRAITDISDRVALRAEEQRFRDLFENDVAANFVSNVEGEILACNQAFVDLLGFPSIEAAIGSGAEPIVKSLDDRRVFLDLLEKEKALNYFETEMKRLDGTPINVIENVIGVFDESGKLTEIRGHLIDVTDRRRLADQLRQAQRMEAVGRLAGGIAHDFNNLLTSIGGHAELILSEPELEEDSQADLKEILKAVGQAAALTSQLLAFGRQQIIEPALLDVADVVRGVLPMMRRTLGEDLRLSFSKKRKKKGETTLVVADKGQLEELVLNLIVNAQEALPTGGRIDISVSPRTIAEADASSFPELEPGKWVVLEVRDDGEGIPADVLNHIFDPFYTTKDIGRGRGLGLATVYGMAKQAGGHVEVESEVGAGSTFTLFLPAATEDGA